MSKHKWAYRLIVASLGLSGAMWIHACVIPPSPSGGDAVVSARSALTVAGSIGLQKSFAGNAATQVAADRLEEVQYAQATCGGDKYKGEFVTASVTTSSTLAVNLARISDTGTFTNEGSTWTDSATIKKAAIAGLDRSLFAVATRTSSDKLTLRVFDASSGSPTQLATYSSSGDSAVANVADLAIARVPVNNSANGSSTADSTTDTNIIKVVATTATTSGDLQISVFDINKSTGAITRQTTGGCCVAATKVAVAVPGRPQGMFVTAALDSIGRVFVVDWQINDSGQLVERYILQMPDVGGYTDVSAAAAGYRRAAVYAGNSLSATLATFDISGQWDQASMAMRASFADSNPIQGAKLVSGGSSRLFVVGRRGANQVVRSYLATTTIQDLDEETDASFGASTGNFAAAVLESSRLVTAGITSANAIRLSSWRDYHVPVARGFWPTTGTRTPASPPPPPPGDNSSTFGFDTGLGRQDLSIAASDQYVVTCSYDRCKFLDKAGQPLLAKYTGAGEYTGNTVPLSWEAGAGPGLFDSAVGQPGVASAPVPEESLLRHLEIQHACDPELAVSDRNLCPTQSYDSSVTYDLFLQRFVIVTQFRYWVGCGDPNGRYPAIAISKTTDPRDGFYVYVSLELGGRDMPRVSAQNGMAIVNWNGGGGLSPLQMNGMVWELADLIGTPKASPRVTKIDKRQIPADGYQPPVAASGDAPVGFVFEQNRNGDSDTTVTVWSFPKTTVGPVGVTRHDFRLPWQMNSGEIGVNPGIAKFTQVAPGLFDGHFYLAGQRSNRRKLRIVDLNFRYSSSTNDLWLVGTNRQELPCVHPVSGQDLDCRVYGPIVDSQGRVVINYTSLAYGADIGPDGYAATNYALLQTPLAPPSSAVISAGDQYNDQSVNGIDLDFVLASPDPTNGFWTIGGRSKGSGYAPAAGRVVPPAIPAYSGVGRLWGIDSSGTDLASSFAWQDTTWRQYKQIVHADFDGDTLEDVFLYYDKAGEGRLYNVGTFGLGSQAIGPVTSGLSSTLYIVPLEVCGGTGQLCPGSISNSTRELLFYDWAQGDASFYRVDASTHKLVKIASNATRTTWALIANGNYTTDSGEELLFYDPTKSEFVMYEISSAGALINPKSNVRSEIGADATALIAGEFDPDALDEVYVYTPYQAKGRFYRLDNGGAMAQSGSDQATRATWTQVAVMSNGWNTLVQYDPSLPPASGGVEPTGTATDGTLRFTKVANGTFGASSDVLLRGNGNGRDWNEMMTAHFRSNSAQDVLLHRLIAPAPPPCNLVDGVCRQIVVGHPSGCRSDGSAYMLANQGLYPNQFMLSCDGRFRLYMQGDGNLVLSMKDSGGNFSIALWTSGTSGLQVDVLAMQGDGNLVMYNSDVAPVWATHTSGMPDLHLKISNDGNMKLYDAAYGTPWQTNTGGH